MICANRPTKFGSFPLLSLEKAKQIQGQKLNVNFFSQTFRATPGYPGKIPGYPARKVCFPSVSRDIPNFLAPTPFTSKTPTPPEDIQTQKLGFVLLFLA